MGLLAHPGVVLEHGFKEPTPTHAGVEEPDLDLGQVSAVGKLALPQEPHSEDSPILGGGKQEVRVALGDGDWILLCQVETFPVIGLE
ncbi:hypothetical protein [Vitiosangium sp. GDMCC 1.1324]|uniref:hypothetical protein n=1 Tax=Vitiosangium sp. (strain GDMCC 1.1324) TaxID=2138576 RepID=UPI000D3517E5|nr:hypothetical protein [Vitiosangium sp. GDMCC 1.1324]PTL80154.1 hypothetical protein DAT35_29525 [Vitiosangium sp. GDMCC 1.1324]